MTKITQKCATFSDLMLDKPECFSERLVLVHVLILVLVFVLVLVIVFLHCDLGLGLKLGPNTLTWE